MTGAALRAARRTRRHPRPWQFDYLHLRRLLDDLRPALAQARRAGRRRPRCVLRQPPVRRPRRARRARRRTRRRRPLRRGRHRHDRVPAVPRRRLRRRRVHRGLPLRHRSCAWCPRAPARREARRAGGRGRPAGLGVRSPHRRAPLHVGLAAAAVRRLGRRGRRRERRPRSRLDAAHRHAPPRLRGGVRRVASRAQLCGPSFALAYVGLNGLGALLDAIEQRHGHPRHVLAPNIMLTARRPADG